MPAAFPHPPSLLLPCSCTFCTHFFYPMCLLSSSPPNLLCLSSSPNFLLPGRMTSVYHALPSSALYLCLSLPARARAFTFCFTSCCFLLLPMPTITTFSSPPITLLPCSCNMPLYGGGSELLLALCSFPTFPALPCHAFPACLHACAQASV